MTIKKLLVALGVLVMGTSLARAGIIFADDFNRGGGNDVGNGWTEIEGNGGGAVINAQGVLLFQPDGLDLSVTHTFDLAGLINPQLTFSYAAQGAPADFLNVLTSADGSVFDLAEALDLSAVPDWTLASIALPLTATYLRLDVAAPNGTLAAYVDDLELTASEESAEGVEPSSASLLIIGAGLLGLGFGPLANRRRKTGRA